MEDFQITVRNSVSPDVSKRAASETRLKFLKANAPEELATNLLTTSALAEDFVSTQALILYRSLLIDYEIFVHTSTSQLFSLVTSSRSYCYLKQLSNILVPLSIEQHFESELLDRISNWLNTPHKPFQVFSLYLLELCTSFSYYNDALKHNSALVLALLWKNLQDGDEEVKIRTCKTTCFILKEIQVGQAGQIIEVVLDLIDGLKEVDVSPALEGILQMLLNYSQALEGREEKIIKVLTKLICGNTCGKTRTAAGNVLLELISPERRKIIETTYFIQELLTTSFILLTEVHLPLDTHCWANAEDCLESDAVELGKLILCHLADVVKESLFSSYLLLFEAHIGSSHWLHIHTAIFSVGLITEDCCRSLESSISYFSQILFTCAKNEHPRIRWASLSSISLFCQFVPLFSQNYTENIFEALMLNLNPANPPRVIEQGVRCLIDFLDITDVGKPKISAFVSVISSLILLPTTPIFVLIQLVNCLTMLVEMTEETGLIQGLIPKLQSAAFMEDLNYKLRIASLLCLGQIVELGFSVDIQSVLDSLLGVKNNMTSCNIVYAGLMKCIGICIVKIGTINEVFRRFLDEILDNSMVNVPFYIEGGAVNDYDFEETKKLSFDENLADNKRTACYICGRLVKGLREKFAPWVERTFDCMIKNLVQAFDYSTKKEALNTAVRLIKEVEIRTAESLALKAFQAMAQVLESNKDQQIVLTMLKGFIRISNIIHGLNVMTLAGASYFSDILSRIIQFFSDLKDKANEPDLDLNIDKIVGKSLELVSILLSSFQLEFKPIFIRYFNPVLGLLFNNSTDEIFSALELLANFIGSTKGLDLLNKEDILNRVRDLTRHQDVDIQELSLKVLSLI